MPFPRNGTDYAINWEQMREDEQSLKINCSRTDLKKKEKQKREKQFIIDLYV